MKSDESGWSASTGTEIYSEVNPEHALIQHIADLQDEERFKEWALTLQEQAQLTEQRRITKILLVSWHA